MSPLLQVLTPLILTADTGVAHLIEHLDSRSFPEREAAAKKLEDIGEVALPSLRVVLTTGKSLEGGSAR